MIEPGPEELGAALEELCARLYPICRSITGDGVRRTLRILEEHVPLEIVEVPSGTRVLDWTVPREWNIRDAWIANLRGERVVDFKESNLHVVSYSVPVRARMRLEDLRKHLHTLPEHPAWIPYRTSYYAETWGFCLEQERLDAMRDEEYDVVIDSTLEPGSLSYGELLVPGRTDEEVLISAHVCHPSLCDDNLSGIAVSAFLAKRVLAMDRRYTYRFLYVPGTIGSITWLATHAEEARRIRHGLTLVCLGDRNRLTYKRTLGGNAEIDRAAALVLGHSGREWAAIDYFPYGYDERQFNSPGFRLPVGSLMRGRHGLFPEYHTSADDLDFVSGGQLVAALESAAAIVRVLEGNRAYRNLKPHGEPQLGKYGIYRAMGGPSDVGDLQLAMLWVLTLSDGGSTLLDVAERAGMPFELVRSAADLLLRHGLLGEPGPEAAAPLP